MIVNLYFNRTYLNRAESHLSKEQSMEKSTASKSYEGGGSTASLYDGREVENMALQGSDVSEAISTSKN